MIHRLHEMIGSHHRTHHGRVERHHVPHRVPFPQSQPHGAQQEQPLRTAPVQPHAGTHAAGEAGLLRVVPMANQRCRRGFCSTDGCGAAVCGQGDPPSSGSGCDVKLIYSSPLQLICGLSYLSVCLHRNYHCLQGVLTSWGRSSRWWISCSHPSWRGWQLRYRITKVHTHSHMPSIT